MWEDVIQIPSFLISAVSTDWYLTGSFSIAMATFSASGISVLNWFSMQTSVRTTLEDYLVYWSIQSLVLNDSCQSGPLCPSVHISQTVV